MVGVPCGQAAEFFGAANGLIEVVGDCRSGDARQCAGAAVDLGADAALIGVVYGPLKHNSKHIYVKLGGDVADIINDPGDLAVSLFIDSVEALDGALSAGRDSKISLRQLA